MPASQTVTQLLIDWRAGDDAALERLTPLVYEELHRLAERYMRSERRGHTLQATGIVHEAFERLIDMEVSWRDRAHFLAVAARTMRRILIDYARAQQRQKRGGPRPAVTLNEGAVPAPEPEVELLALDDALHQLATFDERKARIIELHYFGGLTYEETAEAVGVSAVTVHRELKIAKAWLRGRLEEADGP